MATRPHRSRLFRRVIALAALPTLLTGTALALPRQDAVPTASADTMPYSLVRTYKTDEENKYKLELRTNFSGTDIVFTTVLTEKAKEVKTNGDTTLVYTASAAYLKFGDNEMDASDSLPTVTLTRDSSGKVTDTKVVPGNGPGAQVFGAMMPDFIQAQLLFYPPKPVKVGDSWKIDYKDEKAKAKASGTAKVAAMEKIGDLNTLKIKTSDLKIDGGGGERRMDGDVHLEATTGRFVRLAGTVNSDNGPTGKAKFDVTITLMKGDSKIDEAKKDDKVVAPVEKTDK